MSPLAALLSGQKCLLISEENFGMIYYVDNSVRQCGKTFTQPVTIIFCIQFSMRKYHTTSH